MGRKQINSLMSNPTHVLSPTWGNSCFLWVYIEWFGLAWFGLVWFGSLETLGNPRKLLYFESKVLLPPFIEELFSKEYVVRLFLLR